MAKKSTLEAVLLKAQMAKLWSVLFKTKFWSMADSLISVISTWVVSGVVTGQEQKRGGKQGTHGTGHQHFNV